MNRLLQLYRQLPIILVTTIFFFCSFTVTKDNDPRIYFKGEKLKINSESIIRNVGELLSFQLFFERKLKKSEGHISTYLIWEIEFIDESPFYRKGEYIFNFTKTTLYDSQKSNPKLKSGDLRLGEINEAGEFEYIIRLIDTEDNYVYGETTGTLIINELGNDNNDLGGF